MGEVGRTWALYPHGAGKPGVSLSPEAAVTVAEAILAGAPVGGDSPPWGVTHLLAADEELSMGRWGAYVTLCGEDVCLPGPYSTEHECGLRCECVRYCPECAREACQWSARS